MSKRDISGLRPFGVLSPDEAREIRRKGQAAQVEARRRKRALREVLDVILSQPAELEQIADGRDLAEAVQEVAHAAGRALDQYDAVAIAQVVRAQAGDTAAAVWVRDSAGDKPGEVVQLGEGMTDGDRELLHRVARRVGMDETGADAGGSGSGSGSGAGVGAGAGGADADG